MEDTNSTFEQRLKKYRENKGLLKKEMARKLKVSESYYNTDLVKQNCNTLFD